MNIIFNANSMNNGTKALQQQDSRRAAPVVQSPLKIS